MGICKFCQKKAGIFKGYHKECLEKYENGKNEIISLIGKIDIDNPKKVLIKIDEICASSHINDDEKQFLKKQGWNQAVDECFEDNLLTEQEEDFLAQLVEILEFDQNELQSDSHFRMIYKGRILREMMKGDFSESVKFEGVPFNLQKQEKLVWIFENTKYSEMRTKRHYEGGATGVSVRVAKGVYLRSSSFKGHPVESSEIVEVDTGLLGITTKHIYFAGSVKSFRIKFDKIVSYTPYEDGLGIQRDAQTAKPQIFINNDGWFLYNLVQNVGNIE